MTEEKAEKNGVPDFDEPLPGTVFKALFTFVISALRNTELGLIVASGYPEFNGKWATALHGETCFWCEAQECIFRKRVGKICVCVKQIKHIIFGYF